jgi:hypothetical protein
MKTTRIRVERIQVRMSAAPRDARAGAAEVGRRIAAQVARRAGGSLPAEAAGRLAERLARAFAAARRS